MFNNIFNLSGYLIKHVSSQPNMDNTKLFVYFQYIFILVEKLAVLLFSKPNESVIH